MERQEFTGLRERCLGLVKKELLERYDGELLDDYITLTLQHRMLPPAALVVETYKGIIGYRNWLRSVNLEPGSFVGDALHDLSECRAYTRNDGYSPRTHGYLEHYEPEEQEQA